MKSIAKLSQTLKSINLTLIIFNAVVAFFNIIGLVFIYIGSKSMNSPEFIAELEAQGVSPEELAALQSTFLTPANLVLIILPLLLLIAIIVLLIINQGKIKKEVAWPLPYYAGIGFVIFEFLSPIIQGIPVSIFALLFDVIPLILYIAGFYYTKQLADAIDSND